MTGLLVIKFIVVVTLICALFTSGSAAINTCGEVQFRCQNGDCIQSELLCDGRADCSDQSDETHLECTKPELTCPSYAFRCSYGACVNGDATCNGVKDCLDNSDETLARCPGISGADPDGGCGLENYRCKSGQCISSTSLCDGTVECTDGSDETSLICGSFSCSQLVFRCNYGACIDGDLRCNNVSDCADGSDEDPLLCGRPEPRPPTERPPTPTSNCVAPPQPENGFWKLHRVFCPGFDGGYVDCDVPRDMAFRPGYKLIYGCNSGYMLRGNPEVHCEHGGSWASLPVCTEIKCSALNSAAVTTSCTTKNDNAISCASAVPPDTVATIRCQLGYRKDTNYITSRNNIVSCNATGHWVPTPLMCIPVCGVTILTNQVPLIINGTIANVTQFPWHATLYGEERTNAGVQKKFRCGATIIQTNLVMTAAHCIYDENFRTTVASNKLWIMTGNIFRDFDSPLHNPLIVKKSSVKNVYRHCQYHGLIGNYGSDIALLELESPFELSDILLPACLDTEGISTRILEVGKVGRVAGFGRTAAGTSSSILQTIRVPYVSYYDCQQSQNAKNNLGFISSEKFCGGYNNGSAVCDGDSGGGLVFQHNQLWYVMGIVSLGLGTSFDNGDMTCDAYSYTLYTRVPNYVNWIQKIISDLENYKTPRDSVC